MTAATIVGLALWVVGLPLFAALACVTLVRTDDRAALVAVIASGATLTAAAVVFAFAPVPYEAARGALLRIDSLGALALVATAAAGFAIAVYSRAYAGATERPRALSAYLLLAVGLGCGVAVAANWLLLLVCWGGLAIALYLLVGLGGERAAGAAEKSFLIVGGADALLVLGVVLVWVGTGATAMPTVPVDASTGGAFLAFVCFLAAALAKAGAVPLHGWVPDCCREAPVPVAALMPAALDKILGVYLLVRTVTLFAPDATTNGWIMALGAVGIVAPMILALAQHDMKDVLAYHAIAQVGYILLGVGSGTAVGLAGGLFHGINNAIFKPCLFLCAGNVERQAGTTDLGRLGGLARPMPVTFGVAVVGCLALSGIPPLNGFASKWMIYQSLVESGDGGSRLWPLWLAAAIFGSALTLACLLKVLHAVFLRKATPELAARTPAPVEVGAAMWLPPAVLAGLCVLFGVFARDVPLRHLIFPAIDVPVELPGVWWSGPATVMLFAAMAGGVALYLLTLSGRIRRSETYVGGEKLEETWVTGVTRGAARDVEVSGVEFFETIRDLPVLRAFYSAAERGRVDPYERGRAWLLEAAAALGRAHSGRLTTYVAWVIAGMAAVLWMLAESGG